MAETKTSGSWNLDGIAAKLQAKADAVLHSSGSTASKDGEEGAAATNGGKREALKNVANIVKEQAGKGIGSSKEYLSQVVEKVSAYATETSATASQQFAGVKEKGATHFNTASETANVHYAAVKENINKAIAQGQVQATNAASTAPAHEATTDEATTDRELPAEAEPLKFPYNVIAWVVSLCHGKLSSVGTTSDSTNTASKDFSVESLRNAANTLTEALAEGTDSSVGAASEKIDAAKSSESAEVESTT